LLRALDEAEKIAQERRYMEEQSHVAINR